MGYMNRKSTLISVILPVYNAAPYLPAALSSILNQTHSNFELIAIDDHSTDDSYKILRDYAKADRRIHVFRNSRNLGVSASANIAISHAKSPFIARMDADDIMDPKRLSLQLKYLQNHPKTIALGSQCVCIDADNKIVGYKKFPVSSKKLAEMIFWAAPIQQPSIMVNANLLPKNFVWYNPKQGSAEEIDLIFKLLKYGKVNNLPNYLHFYRQLPGSLSHKNPKQTFQLTIKSRLNAIKRGEFTPSVKAIFLNLAQIVAVALLPNLVINKLWEIIRGINVPNNRFQIGSEVKVYIH
jgi:glycosyltransferase involved in cell wall biosynthesis